MSSTMGLESRHRYEPKSSDLVTAGLSFVFAFLSLISPSPGRILLFGQALERANLAIFAFLAIGALSLLLPLIDESRAPWPLRFARTFYPQAFIGLFFVEAIALSSRIDGGRSYDPIFAALDQALFGLQPARELSAGLSSLAWLNELMFGSYFLYYVLLAVTPWIPWFLGRKEEAERQLYVFLACSALLDLFYVFFRVQGPKYWFPDLRAAWYGHFEGGFFVAFFQRAFNEVVLSGAAFPSSHVAHTSLFLLFAYRTDRRLLALYLPAWLLISTSTVYIYAHYAIDGLAGLAFALLLGPLLLKARDPAGLLAGKSLYSRSRAATEFEG